MKRTKHKIVLLPIFKKFFDKLMSGEKNIEIRKHLPRLKFGDSILFYDVEKLELIGRGEVDKVVEIYKIIQDTWAYCSDDKWCRVFYYNHKWNDEWESGISDKELFDYTTIWRERKKHYVPVKIITFRDTPTKEIGNMHTTSIFNRRFSRLKFNIPLKEQKYIIWKND